MCQRRFLSLARTDTTSNGLYRFAVLIRPMETRRIRGTLAKPCRMQCVPNGSRQNSRQTIPTSNPNGPDLQKVLRKTHPRPTTTGEVVETFGTLSFFAMIARRPFFLMPAAAGCRRESPPDAAACPWSDERAAPLRRCGFIGKPRKNGLKTKRRRDILSSLRLEPGQGLYPRRGQQPRRKSA